MKFPIYFDYNSTTPIDKRVLDVMLPYLSDKFGNASSNSHTFGREAAAAVEFARKQIADLINAKSDEIFFTSSTTESCNLAIKGIVESSTNKKIRIISSPIEHKSVLNVLTYLEKFGVEIYFLKTDEYGFVSPGEVKEAIDGNTVLVSVMTANNEIGTIQPIGEIGMICNEFNVPFFSDAAQAIGKIPMDMNTIPVDLMAFGAHKIYGPKGAGALYIRKGSKKIKLTGQIHGGMQEGGLRSGTLDVPAIAGFGKAAQICKENLAEEFSGQTLLRDRIINNLLHNCEDAGINGHPVKRLPNNINIYFKGIPSQMLINKFPEFAISSGSACSSETLEPSFVLRNIGRDLETANSSIRISIGRFTTGDEVSFLIKRLIEGIKELKNF
jgi:cysteine desulfurase